jgi:hypothetical protein
MSNFPFQGSTVYRLLLSCVSAERAQLLGQWLEVHADFLKPATAQVSRGALAQAMNMLLFSDLVERYPIGKAYVLEKVAAGQKAVFDHGALRTVALTANGDLPSGIAAFTRILEPLGFYINGHYPLERLKMTGRSMTHKDYPQHIAQFFVSELHPEKFSEKFQTTVADVVATSRDPLTMRAKSLLAKLHEKHSLPFADAAQLLPEIVGAFNRQHAMPSWDQYQTLLAESKEMAWISTEGNVFNHATDRVPDVARIADEERVKGRPIKDSLEVSANQRVIQTAFKANDVERVFVTADGAPQVKAVPGSFYELITRHPLPDSADLDLSFDTSNATGIFKMTAAAM